MATLPFFTICVATLFLRMIQCQYFSPNMTDQAYLDITHNKVKTELVQSRQLLVDQADVIEQATRAYIGAKIKENLFKALRILAEKELESLSMQNRPRQPRQDEDYDEETTTQEGLIPQIATIVKAIFGNSNVNVTKYVESASKFLPRPIGSQIVGVVSLLDPNKFTTTTAPRLVLPPTRDPVNFTVMLPQPAEGSQTLKPIIISDTKTQPSAASKTTPRMVGTGDEDDDDGIRSEGSKRKAKQQFTGVNPMDLLNSMEALWMSYQPNITTTTTLVPHVKAGVTTESADGFEDEYTTKPSRATAVLNGVMTQAQNLRKGVPDLFQGAREAYKFLETINGFLDKWSARLAAGSAEEDE